MATLALAAVPLLLVAQNPPAEAPGGPDFGDPQFRGPRGPMRGPMGGPGMGMGMRRGMGPGMGLGLAVHDPALRERLGLTSEQVAKIEAQSSAFAKTRVRGRADLEVKRMELGELLHADKPDRAAIDRKLRELHDAEFALHKADVDHQLGMRDVLTPEQRTKLEELRAERMRAFRDDRMGRPGMGRGPGMRRGPGFGPMGP
jgi:Spy/CpxP family protein refolding chaperone